jgi:hypothetical protein
MPDLILRDIEPTVLTRVTRWADARGWSVDAAVVWLLERGLVRSSEVTDLEEFDARVLREAIAALEQVPSDPGFALIGRPIPEPPRPAPEPPDQSIISTAMPPA